MVAMDANLLWTTNSSWSVSTAAAIHSGICSPLDGELERMIMLLMPLCRGFLPTGLEASSTPPRSINDRIARPPTSGSHRLSQRRETPRTHSHFQSWPQLHSECAAQAPRLISLCKLEGTSDRGVSSHDAPDLSIDSS
jgi:hypothetical protein